MTDTLSSSSSSSAMEKVDKPESAEESKPKGPKLTFKLVFGKENHEITMSSTSTIGELKETVHELTKIHPNMQKLLYKGNLSSKPDSLALEQANVVNGAKVILMASQVSDILSIAAPPPTSKTSESSSSSTTSTPWREMTEHKKVLDKGKPEITELEAGLGGKQMPIPSKGYVVGVNKYGAKTRLSFKLDQLWIATAERTQKVPLDSIRTVTSQPQNAEGDYVILAIQLGPTEASRYFLYWIPAQYVEAIKNAILGWPSLF